MWSSLTKSDLESALQGDERSLAKIRKDIRKLESGADVENLTLGNARVIEQSLKQVIANKRRLLKKI